MKITNLIIALLAVASFPACERIKHEGNVNAVDAAKKRPGTKPRKPPSKLRVIPGQPGVARPILPTTADVKWSAYACYTSL